MWNWAINHAARVSDRCYTGGGGTFLALLEYLQALSGMQTTGGSRGGREIAHQTPLPLIFFNIVIFRKISTCLEIISSSSTIFLIIWEIFFTSPLSFNEVMKAHLNACVFHKTDNSSILRSYIRPYKMAVSCSTTIVLFFLFT